MMKDSIMKNPDGYMIRESIRVQLMPLQFWIQLFAQPVGKEVDADDHTN